MHLGHVILLQRNISICVLPIRVSNNILFFLPSQTPYRFYSCPKHRNRIHADLLRCEFTFHNEVGQQRYNYNVRTRNLVKTVSLRSKETDENVSKM